MSNNQSNSSLALAKSIIADQQMAIAQMNNQLSGSYGLTETGQVLHIYCGEPGLEYDDEAKAFIPCCSCAD